MGAQGSDREPAGPAGAATLQLISECNTTCLWLVTPRFIMSPIGTQVNKNGFLSIQSSTGS